MFSAPRRTDSGLRENILPTDIRAMSIGEATDALFSEALRSNPRKTRKPSERICTSPRIEGEANTIANCRLEVRRRTRDQVQRLLAAYCYTAHFAQDCSTTITHDKRIFSFFAF
jgi:hypothetical protein